MFITLTVIAHHFSDVKHNLSDGIFEKTILPISHIVKVAQGSTGGHSDEYREVTRVYTDGGPVYFVKESFQQLEDILNPSLRPVDLVDVRHKVLSWYGAGTR